MSDATDTLAAAARTAPTPPSAGGALARRVAQRWQAFEARERRALVLVGVVLALFLSWTLAVAPAWRTLRAAPAQIDALDAQLQGMQRLAAEARALRAVPPLPAAQALAALQPAVQRLGAGARLTMQGDRAVLTLTDIGPQTLRSFLAEARSAARARPIEAALTRGPNGFGGQLVLALGSAS